MEKEMQQVIGKSFENFELGTQRIMQSKQLVYDADHHHHNIDASEVLQLEINDNNYMNKPIVLKRIEGSPPFEVVEESKDSPPSLPLAAL